MDPQQNTAQPPSVPTPPGQGEISPTTGRDSELYNQIASGDAEPVVIKKKNKPILVSLMAVIMRYTLWLDSVKRTHERLFRALGTIWACFMGVLYLSGILIVVFSLYNRLQLPVYLEDQLHA